MKVFPPFKLDTVNQCLWRERDMGGDERILLPPKAFSVLCYLVEHAGRLVTQDELLDAVWPDTHIQPEGLKGQILNLRRVLGDHPQQPRYIETLPRRGYCFIGAVSTAGAPHPPTPGRAAAHRLVGREAALGQLSDALRRTLERERQIVFLTGEPGIGKTALADAFQLQIDGTVLGLRIARGQCVEGYGGKEPYYPMLEALGRLWGAPGGESVVAALAERAPTWLAQFPALLQREHRETLQREILGATRDRMLREIREAVETIAADNPLLLVFEDLQWVDQATVDLISVLARHRSSAKLMLIGTYRPGDLTPANHPLQALKQELLMHQLCREIALEPLSEGNVAEFLAAPASGTGQPPGLAELMHRHSGGNPLFMVAALEHLMQRGLIARENSSWQLRLPLGEIVVGVPEGLRPMIEAQFERLSADEQRVLEAASVVGTAFTVDVAATAAELTTEGFEDLCDRLSRQRRIVRPATASPLSSTSSSQRYEFIHALYREVLYQRLGPSRRAKLHRSVGKRIEALYAQRTGEAAPELAHHFEQSGDWLQALSYLQLAADSVGRRFGPRQAAAILEHALALVNRLPAAERAQHEISVLESLGKICTASQDSRGIGTMRHAPTGAAPSGRARAHSTES